METLKGQVNQLESGDAASIALPMGKQIAEDYKRGAKGTFNLIFPNVKESEKTDSLTRRK